MEAAATGNIAGALADAIAFEKQAAALQAATRRDVARFAAVFCSCSPWFDWADRTPPQAACGVHGNLIITPEGAIL